MSPQEAISVMESLEKKFQVLKWRARLRQARLANPENTNSFEIIEPYDNRAEITFDPIGGRFFVRMSLTCPWFKGAAPFISKIQEQSFDGEIYREVEWSKHGTTLPTPQDSPGFGTITNDKINLSTPGKTINKLGISYMPPYLSLVWANYPAERLSRIMRMWLEEGKDVTVVEEIPGEWTIGVKLKISLRACGTTCEPVEFECLCQVTYDLNKGGVVTGVRELAPDKKGELNFENTRIEIELQEVSGGFWVPKMVKVVWPLDKQMDIYSYEDVEINPPVTDDTFRLDFPNGVYVDDYVNKMFYEAGKVMDRESASQHFMRRHRLTG